MDNPLEQIRKIEPREWHFMLLVFFGLLSPGILSIWLYHPSLITDVSFLVLVLLSLSLMIPASFINYYIFNHEKENASFADYGAGVIILGTSVGLLIIINLFVSMSLKYYVVSAALINFVMVYFAKKQIYN